MGYRANPNQKPSSASTQLYSANTAMATVATTTATLSGLISPASISLTNNGTWTTSAGCAAARPQQSPPPANWSTISIRSSPFLDNGDVHEAPVVGRAAYVASLSVSNANGMHHWKLFTRLHPEIEYLMCGIAESEHSRQNTTSNIMFIDETSFAVFENWFAEYCANFGGKENLYSYKMPPPPRVMGYSVQIMMAKHEDLAELSEWIMSNCEDKVYALGEMLFFLNDEDATLYKLRFNGN